MDASQNSLNKIEATLTPVFVLGVLALVVGVIDAAVLIYFALPTVNLASALVELVNQGGAAGIGAPGSQADEIIKLTAWGYRRWTTPMPWQLRPSPSPPSSSWAPSWPWAPYWAPWA